MRITGGTLGGRQVAPPPGQETRPTQDKVRAALFSSLAAAIPGCRFLDLFAGTGAVGLEAWSRGASHVCWVESHRPTYLRLLENVERLCGPGNDQPDGRSWRAAFGNAIRFIERERPKKPFDIVFADPPYHRADRPAWATMSLRALLANPMLIDQGRVVLEQSVEEQAPSVAGWELIGERRYGGTAVRLFRRAPTPERTEHEKDEKNRLRQQASGDLPGHF